MRRWTMVTGLVLAVSGCALEEGGGADNTGGFDTNGGEGAFDPLYFQYFHRCSYCHAPNAPGWTSDIEKTLDFTSVETAFNTLKHGRASGLVGNQEACNGVAFIGSTYESSLVAAVLDENVRADFYDPSYPYCVGDGTISDMTVKVSVAPSSAFLGTLREWIDNGAPR